MSLLTAIVTDSALVCVLSGIIDIFRLDVDGDDALLRSNISVDLSKKTDVVVLRAFRIHGMAQENATRHQNDLALTGTSQSHTQALAMSGKTWTRVLNEIHDDKICRKTLGAVNRTDQNVFVSIGAEISKLHLSSQFQFILLGLLEVERADHDQLWLSVQPLQRRVLGGLDNQVRDVSNMIHVDCRGSQSFGG